MANVKKLTPKPSQSSQDDDNTECFRDLLDYEYPSLFPELGMNFEFTEQEDYKYVL